MKRQIIKNIPSIITSIRIILIPFIINLYLNNRFLAALTLVVISALTDYFDGKLARVLKLESTFGTFFDPVADKFFELSLVAACYLQGDMPLYYVAVLWLRNILQLLSIPVLIGWKKISFKVAPKLPAKFATFLGMLLIVTLFFALACKQYSYFSLSDNLLNSLYYLFPLSAILEIYILATYAPRFVAIYQGKHDTFE